jgi:MATE family multidrug resistance protein
MNKEILRLAFPNIISNISVPLLSAVDTMLMGHLSVTYLAALGIGSMIFVFLYGNFNFLRMGTTGICAQFYGKDDKKELANTLFRAIVLASVCAFVLLLFKDWLYEISIVLMNVESSYESYVRDYFDIRIYTSFALFAQLAIFGWFFGLQDAKSPLFITIAVNIINIFFSVWFVNYLDMGIKGVAYGTLIAQYCGVAFAIFSLRKYKSILKHFEFGEIFKIEELRRFLNINSDIFIRTVALTFVLAFFYSQSAKVSKELLSMMVVLLQFLIWMSFAIDGFANATESLVGRFYGAKDWDRFYKAIRYNFYYAFGLALIFCFVYAFWGREIVELYTQDQDLVNRVSRFLPLVSLLPLISFGAFIWDGVFIGMTASKALRDVVLLSMLLFLAIFYIFRSRYDYAFVLWIDFMVFFLFRSILQSYLFYKKRENLR